jgi:hypothetical protein
MNLKLSPALLSICACSIAQVVPAIARGQEVTCQAAGKLNADGLWDAVLTRKTAGTLSVYFGVSANSFTAAVTYAVQAPTCLVIADLNGDGKPDVAVGSAKSTGPEVVLFLNDGTGGLIEWAHVSVPIVPSLIVARDFCGDGFPEMYITEGEKKTYVEVADAMSGLGTRVIETTSAAPTCTRVVTAQPCNNLTEPDCEPSVQTEGVQECMRAAECRADKCHWAACVNWEAGGNFFKWVGQNLACGAVADLEIAGCLSSAIPHIK